MLLALPALILNDDKTFLVEVIGLEVLPSLMLHRKPMHRNAAGDPQACKVDMLRFVDLEPQAL
jgi:hypothetical protein